MKSNADKVRGASLSSNHDGSPASFVAATAWRSRTPSAPLGNASTIHEAGHIPLYSIASDDRLLATAQSGDQHAFVELCRRHSPGVKKRIFSIVRNQEDAEDALQESLLRAYMYLGTFRRECKFSTWLTSIGTNTALMILRRRRSRKEGHTELRNAESEAGRATEYVDPSPGPADLHSKHQIILVVRREVQRLRPALRSMIEMHYGAECSLEESAKALDISVGTAKARLQRGKQKLRRYLTRRGVSDSTV